MAASNGSSKKRTKLTFRQRRVFSEDFKREKVQQITAGHYKISSFCKLWSLPPVTVYRWIYQYSPEHKKGTTMIVQKDAEATKTQQLLTRVAELERSVGQKQLAIDYLEKLIEVASKELAIDLKKNYKPTL